MAEGEQKVMSPVRSRPEAGLMPRGLQVERAAWKLPLGARTQRAERMESQAWAVDLSRGCRTMGSG